MIPSLEWFQSSLHGHNAMMWSRDYGLGLETEKRGLGTAGLGLGTPGLGF